MSPVADLKTRIVRSATGILRKSGLKRMAQAEVAKKANIRQSHLTYYFPTRSDLVIEVARNALGPLRETLGSFVSPKIQHVLDSKIQKVVASICNDVGRTRALLGLMVESDEDQKLKNEILSVVKEQINMVALLLGKSKEDPQVQLVNAALMGTGFLRYLDAHPPEFTQEMVRVLGEWLKKTPSEKGSE
ncbi:hypothetical protein K2X30_14810 [bacterium]|nr:hypothetical protein [bacterium]